MPSLIEVPITSDQVPHLDGILLTHGDGDHFSELTCKNLAEVTDLFHGPHYVASLLEKLDLKNTGHVINEKFIIDNIGVTLPPAKHNWQNESPKYSYRFLGEDECCGYWFDCQEGSVWLPGDSKQLDSHLNMPDPDVILFDFSDNAGHITFEGAIKLANNYPQSQLIWIHWGSVDAPTMNPFNSNPADLFDRIVNPQRIQVLSPGERFILAGGAK